MKAPFRGIEEKTFRGAAVDHPSHVSHVDQRILKHEQGLRQYTALRDLENYWGGNLAVVRIYSRALTAAEVNQNYTLDVSRFKA